MRWLERMARNIGQMIGDAINRAGHKYGFCLFLFSFNGPEMTFISNADRADMVKALEEFIQRQRSGDANQAWRERN